MCIGISFGQVDKAGMMGTKTNTVRRPAVENNNTEAKYNEFVNSNKYKVSLQQRRGLTFAWRRSAL